MRREATNGEKRKWTHRVAEGKTSVNDEKLLARRRWLESCVKKCPALSLQPFQDGRSAGHQAQGPRPSRRRAGPSAASRGQRRPAPPPLALCDGEFWGSPLFFLPGERGLESGLWVPPVLGGCGGSVAAG